MSVPTLALEIYKGDSFTRDIQFTLNGAAADISGWTAQRAQMRKRPSGDSTPVDFAVSVVNAATGIVRIALTAEQTRDLEGAAWVWDMERETESDGPVTVVRGPVTVTPDVTREEE